MTCKYPVDYEKGGWYRVKIDSISNIWTANYKTKLGFTINLVIRKEKKKIPIEILLFHRNMSIRSRVKKFFWDFSNAIGIEVPISESQFINKRFSLHIEEIDGEFFVTEIKKKGKKS